jgi:hypothetical protein
VELAQQLGADELCIRTPERDHLYNPIWHDDLGRRLQDAGIGLSIWPVVSLANPEAEARAIIEATTRYLPLRVVLDAEGAAKANVANLPRFLLALGRLPVPVGLGSFRRASKHTEMQWPTWWRAKAQSGEFILDFVAMQLYPLGWLTPSTWVAQMSLDVESHEIELARASRQGLPWLPWMPAFIGGTYEGMKEPWIPKVEWVSAAVAFLQKRLGDRLIGFNWWSLDRSLVDIPPLMQYIQSLPGDGPPKPQTFLELPEAKRWELIVRSLQEQGILDAAGVPV